MSRPFTDLAARFWPKVRKTRGCHRWIASTDKDGYGQIGSDARSASPRTMLKAHKVAWRLAGRKIPRGMFVLHTCDHPWCVRLSHLYLGTHQDNMNDMNGRRRNVFHTRNPSLKLSVAQVKKIRALRKKGELLDVLASQFDVNISTISRIANRVRRSEVK